jgi:signal transduction histidine kinase
MTVRGRRSYAYALLLAAPLVAGLAAALELAKVARLASDRAQIECNLVSGTIRRQLDLLARERPGAPVTLEALAADPRLQLVLDDGIEHAPTILHAAVLDTSGVIVAHSIPSRVGELATHAPALPSVEGVIDAVRVAWVLRRRGNTFETLAPLVLGGRSFATVQVVVSADFLRDGVRGAFFGGAVTTLAVLLVTVAAGAWSTRFFRRGVRSLEERVVAIREGRPGDTPGPGGPEELGGLARELDLLEQYVRDSSHGAVANSRILERLSELTSGVAHEMRGPLQTLDLEVARLDDAAREDERLREPVHRIHETVRRLERAIRGFLTVSRVRPLSMERVDLAELLRETAGDLGIEANLAGLELVHDEEADCSVEGDRGVLRQAVENLVRNAIQAQPSRDGKIALRCGRRGNTLSVCVEDTGPGMPEELVDRIFRLFYTTRTEGTGVGMTIVRNAADLHGGHVHVDSQPGRGTSVCLELPAIVAPGAEEEA